MRGSILVVVSDTHIGSTAGLATPTYNIQTRNPHETQEVQANVLQRWLWECWTDFWAYVREKQGKGNCLWQISHCVLDLPRVNLSYEDDHLFYRFHAPPLLLLQSVIFRHAARVR